MKNLKKYIFGLVTVCLLLVLVSDWFNVFNITSTEDLNRCKTYYEKFKEQYKYPTGKSAWADRELIYCTPGAKGIIFNKSDVFSIYTVTDKAQQKAAYELLKTIAGKDNPIPLSIIFYEKENLIEWENEKTGAKGAKRGNEKVIAQYRVN